MTKLPRGGSAACARAGTAIPIADSPPNPTVPSAIAPPSTLRRVTVVVMVSSRLAVLVFAARLLHRAPSSMRGQCQISDGQEPNAWRERPSNFLEAGRLVAHGFEGDLVPGGDPDRARAHSGRSAPVRDAEQD